jgi:uncharacterized membrane protein
MMVLLFKKIIGLDEIHSEPANEVNPMKRLTTLVIIAIVIISVGLTTGCGRKQRTTVSTSTTTLGQELVDLQQAYEKGIITEKQYNDLKKKAIKKYK